MKYVVTTVFLWLAWSLAGAAELRPSGENCSLTRPPADSGEEGGHGFVLQVFPRARDIGPKYSGCQAVFVAGPNKEVRLAWVVEISRGDPIRMWSPDEEMKAVLSCRYKNRQLRYGDPNVCPSAEALLMPTQPAGCFLGKRGGEGCNYDVE